jgi:hypothetical protein
LPLGLDKSLLSWRSSVKFLIPDFASASKTHAFHRRSQGFSDRFLLCSSSDVRPGSDKRSISGVYKYLGTNAGPSKLPPPLAGTPFYIADCSAFGVSHSCPNAASGRYHAPAFAGNADSGTAGRRGAFRRTQPANTRSKSVPGAAHETERMAILASNRPAVTYCRPDAFSHSHPIKSIEVMQ